VAFVVQWSVVLSALPRSSRDAHLTGPKIELVETPDYPRVYMISMTVREKNGDDLQSSPENLQKCRQNLYKLRSPKLII
jgi:hypothetical protein